VSSGGQGGVEPPTFLFSGLWCSVRLRSAPSVACAGASSRPLVDARERTRMRRKKRRVPGHRPHRSTQDFRKRMLYPLSYEGLRCMLPSMSDDFGLLGSGRLPRFRRSVPQLCRVPWARF
jgi:hypothetical protein